MPVVVGIDLAAGRGTTEVAALAFDAAAVGGAGGGWRPPRFVREAYRATQSDDEIVAAACACAPVVIAIDAPLSLPAAVMAALPGATADAAPSHPSAYTRAAERDPIWRTLGVRPFPVSFLGGLTFRALTLLPRLRAAAPDATIIEVFPTATLAALGIRYAAQSAEAAGVTEVDAAPKVNRLPAKTTPARRAATQAGLARWIEGLPDPPTVADTPPNATDARVPLPTAVGRGQGLGPLGADLLDALAAALTAVAYARGQYRAVGDAAEGQIILPLWGATVSTTSSFANHRSEIPSDI